MTPQKVRHLIRKVPTYGILSVEEVRKILIKITIDKDKGCWLYNEDWSVYATYKKQRLHRLMYHIFKEKIKDNNLVCHKCDRPGCINPDHLFQGTPSDNYQDAIRKKRAVNGARTYMILHSKEMKELRKQDNWRQIHEYRYRE